jgi:hypothetical protein
MSEEKNIRSLKWQFCRTKEHDGPPDHSGQLVIIEKILAPKLKIVMRVLSQDPAEGFKIVRPKAGFQDWTPLVVIKHAENECVGGRRVGHHRILRSL